MTTDTSENTEALPERRARLAEQLQQLRSQLVDIERDVQLADQDWETGLAAGDDVSLVAERRKLRQDEAADKTREIATVQQWLTGVDAELRAVRARADHAAVMEQLVTDLDGYAAQERLVDVVRQAADEVVRVATEFHATVTARRDAYEDLTARIQRARSTAAALGVDQPRALRDPVHWHQPVTAELRRGRFWGLWLTVIQNHWPEPVARELGVTAASLITHRRG